MREVLLAMSFIGSDDVLLANTVELLTDLVCYHVLLAKNVTIQIDLVCHHVSLANNLTLQVDLGLVTICK